MEYWRVYEKFAADPTLTDFTELQNLTDGEESRAVMSSIQGLRQAGRVSKGGWRFRDVALRLQDKTSPRQAEVTYCLDRTELILADVDTGSRIDGLSLANLQETATMEQGSDGRWRVILRRNQESKC